MSYQQNPQRVREGKDRIDAGERLPDDHSTMRPFYCRHCGKEQMSAVIPPGWYSLTRHPGKRELRPLRLGTYCSLVCLAKSFPRLQGVEDDLGKNWQGSTAAYRL